METTRKYPFTWSLLGDLSIGRPNLGPQTRLEVYRLMQFTLRDVIERGYGGSEADRIFRDAGKLAGAEFFAHVVGPQPNLNAFISRLQQIFEEMGIGILRVEKSDPEKGHFVLTVSEDLDCSGLPESDLEICKYDEGFISGLLESFTGKAFNVKEIDCWCTGERTCRFEVVAAEQGGA
ncbi:MAG: 4-vinyl reductase [Candidatus Sumerlaeota bacterium]|nr:4-vinyl reductase [Candidatus Sumerlaeota bacterium]